jgi:hypothetical protein
VHLAPAPARPSRPLDHLFHDARLRLREIRGLQSYGSDHLPIHASLLFDPTAEQKPGKPEPKGDDRHEASEKVSEGKAAGAARFADEPGYAGVPVSAVAGVRALPAGVGDEARVNAHWPSNRLSCLIAFEANERCRSAQIMHACTHGLCLRDRE